jgi:hypothetical protein
MQNIRMVYLYIPVLFSHPRSSASDERHGRAHGFGDPVGRSDRAGRVGLFLEIGEPNRIRTRADSRTCGCRLSLDRQRMLRLSNVESDPERRPFDEDLDEASPLGRHDIVLVGSVSGSTVVGAGQSLADLTGLMVTMRSVFLVEVDEDLVERLKFAEAPVLY